MLHNRLVSAGRRIITSAVQKRHMGGGGHNMSVSPVHTKLGEAFGFVCWMWIFHRARNDLPVVLGWRHPWEHAEDPWASYSLEHGHVEELEELQSEWDTFQVKAENPEEDDDEEEEEEDDDDDDEEEEDDDDEEDEE